MSDNVARIRQRRETQTASARRERAAQQASTRGWGQGRRRRVRVPVEMDEGTSTSGTWSRLAGVSSSRQQEEEEVEVPEVAVSYHEAEGVPDVDPPLGEEDEQEEGYPGGSRDTSVLIFYREHVARWIWEGEVFFIICPTTLFNRL